MAKSKTKTKENKIPASVQKYIPLVQSQVKHAMNGGRTDEENIAQLQQEFNDYKNMQSLQAEFDAWKKQNTAPKKSAATTETKVEPIKFMTADERKAYKEATTVKKPGNYDEDKSYGQ